jgi:hypothetical protein
LTERWKDHCAVSLTLCSYPIRCLTIHLHTQLNNLRRDAAEGVNVGSGMLAEWHNETHTAMLDLVSRDRKAQAWLEDARSAQLALEVQRDQGHNKLVQAEEEVARLEETLEDLEKRAEFAEKQMAEKVSAICRIDVFKFSVVVDSFVCLLLFFCCFLYFLHPSSFTL